MERQKSYLEMSPSLVEGARLETCRRQKRLESSNLSISAKTKGFRDFSENLFFSLKKCIITEMICFKGCDIFLVELDELNNLCRLF